MAALDGTRKLQIYHTLYRLNRSFAAIVVHCRTLEETGLVKAKFTRLFQGFAQELQAEINQELLSVLQSTELDDWNRFGKIRDAWEKGLRGRNNLNSKSHKARPQKRAKA